MSRIKSLIQLIGSCEKPEFDSVVKSFLKEVYNYSRVVVTDGKDDTGIDLKTFDAANSKNQYQMTTQKSQTIQEAKRLEVKIFEDIAKAQFNAKEYGWSSNLYYFYSYPMTNKKNREYTRKALNDYGVHLTIIDANQIAQEAEDFLELQKVIYGTSGLQSFALKQSLFDSKEENLMFDLISFGKTAEVKLQIVEAYILQILFSEKNMSKFDIISKCKTKFNSKDNLQFYDKLLARLCTSKKIERDKNLQTYRLSTDEDKNITNLLRQSAVDETEFLKSIHNILVKYNQEHKTEEYLNKLKDIYINNFNSNITIDLSADLFDVSKISRDFTFFIEQNIENKSKIKEMAIALFKECNNNQFLQKTCASKVFSVKTNIDKLEDYVSAKKKVFIDTNIALYLLCYFFKPKNSYDTYYYKTASTFYEFCQKNSNKLFIPERYVWEMQSHIAEAINLIPFTCLPNFSNLGKSRNVLYNFYLFLYEEKIYTDSYTSFLSEFNFKENDHRKTQNQLIEEYLNNLNIEVYKFEYEYSVDDSRELIQKQLLQDHKIKTGFGLSNDAIMLEFLGDNNIDVHPIEPLFVTWDKTFSKVQKEFFRRNPKAQRFHIITPSKFIDHYSLLNFSIGSDMFTSELLALLSDEIINTTHTLLDSLTYILNPSDEVGLAYSKKLSEIRDDEIYSSKETETATNDLDGDAVIDDLFFTIISYYKDSGRIGLLKKLFSIKELIPEVIQIIIDSVEHLKSTHENIDINSIINPFEVIMERIVLIEKEKYN